MVLRKNIITRNSKKRSLKITRFKYAFKKIFYKSLKVTYKLKFYIDVAVSQISWITGKLPELASVVILLQFFGIKVSKDHFIYCTIFGAFSLLIIGIVLKKTGFYDTEVLVDTEKNPVSRSIFKASKIIIKKWDKAK